MVIGPVIRVNQVAQAHVRMLQGGRGIADQGLAAFTDVGEFQLAFSRVALKPEHQPRNVAGNPLEPGLAFAQGRQRPAPFSHVGEKHHQVLGIAKAQKAQRHIHRQQAAIGAQALGFEMQGNIVAGPCAFPQFKPAVHMQSGLEVDQWPVDHRTLGIAKHVFSGAVGITHMAIPVDPENAHRALVDGELTQAQGLFPCLTLVDGLPRSQQVVLQLTQLAPLPHHDGNAAEQQRSKQ
ncbi:hypothetical protein D3C81_1295970 [compost metagenome]